MHIQVVTFNLKEINKEEFIKMCEQMAPAFASIPGLISKVWLSDQNKNIYGGVYSWSDRHAMEAYTTSGLFQGMAANPHLTNLNSRDYAVLEELTKVTRGLVAATV